MNKRTLSILLVFTMLLAMRPMVMAADNMPSTWAEQEVQWAIDDSLVPGSLQTNYQAPATRAAVAELFVRLLENSSSQSIESLMDNLGVVPNPNAFTDTRDPNVLACNALGIIKGVGDGRFDPDGILQRAQIAAIINRAARVLGKSTEGYSHSFTDVSGHWCDSELGWPVGNGIINGIGGGKFDPNSNLTVEQAIAITQRASVALADSRTASASNTVLYDRDGLKITTDGMDTSSSKFVELKLVIENRTGRDLRIQCWNGSANGRVAEIHGSSDVPNGSTIRDWIYATWEDLAAIGVKNIVEMDFPLKVIFEENGEKVYTDTPVFHVTVPGAYDDFQPETDSKLRKLTVAGKTYTLGMSANELRSIAGEPDEVIPSIRSYDWYVFGTDSYADRFFMAGVQDNVVVTLCASGPSFTYLGRSAGAKESDFPDENPYAGLYFDKNDNNALHGIALVDTRSPYRIVPSAQHCTGESRAIFHLTNGFRAYHGLRPLTWDDNAAKAAVLHSTDMMVNQFFSHTSPNGDESWDRMKKQGIIYKAAGENIEMYYTYIHINYTQLVQAMQGYDGWVNSSGHRKIMLGDKYTHLGVGISFNSNYFYATQNFWG